MRQGVGSLMMCMQIASVYVHTRQSDRHERSKLGLKQERGPTHTTAMTSNVQSQSCIDSCQQSARS
jgi:hypothetical protein